MIDITSFFSTKPPSLKPLPLKRYRVNLSFNRLVFGVDGIHFDVHISPQVLNAVTRAVSVLLIKHSHSEDFFEDGKKVRQDGERLALRHVCMNVLLEGINKAKAKSEVQIDLLGQIALVKMVLEEIQNEYRKLTLKFENLIRDQELSRDSDQVLWLKMKDKLTEIKQNQKRIVRLTGEELFQMLADIQVRDLKKIRESVFPAEYILPDHFFINPTIHTSDVSDDSLLMDAYVLLSQRSDEPDNYGNLKSIIDDLFGETDLERENIVDTEREKKETKEADISSDGNALDPWLMEVDNIDLMFDYFDTREQYRKAKKDKEPKDILLELKSWIKIQEKLFHLFYRRFKQSQLLKLIVTAYEMQPIYRGYCPPLRPMQVREYLIKYGSRKSVVRELKRRKMDGVTLTPLHETIRRIQGCSTRHKKEYFLSFLKDFLRYHRDLENGRLLKRAMEAINLVTDEKTLLLSRANRLLHEYMLPEERTKEEKPVIGHVIIKADIRGSLDILDTMRTKGLNPASYFSLNFFDPISEILGDYDASNVFVEGDAIILSIFENEDTALGGYSVARACGLAARILDIVQRYNVKNQKHDLPILELGIGICYKQGPPAFLFAGKSKIMISPAINIADRLSGCNRKLRKRFKNRERVFNLHVFQSFRDEDTEDPADDLSLRYNVNGIELEPEGFAKLSGEINLKRIEYPAENNEKVMLYTGKVPTLSGSNQRLVIRESAVLAIKPETMDVIGPTSGKYYEVCTHPAIYGYVDTHE